MKFLYIVSAIQILLVAAGFKASAQDIQEGRDSVIFRLSDQVDSTLVGKSIFNIISGTGHGQGNVSIHQSQAIINAMRSQIDNNSSRTFSGYRVRIFFDNSQNARTASENAVKNFTMKNPGIPAYRSYQNPFFKVTVGDFRTKSEAMEFLQKIKGEFPAAFVVKEDISYPAADKNNTFVADTVKVF